MINEKSGSRRTLNAGGEKREESWEFCYKKGRDIKGSQTLTDGRVRRDIRGGGAQDQRLSRFGLTFKRNEGKGGKICASKALEA